MNQTKRMHIEVPCTETEGLEDDHYPIYYLGKPIAFWQFSQELKWGVSSVNLSDFTYLRPVKEVHTRENVIKNLRAFFLHERIELDAEDVYNTAFPSAQPEPMEQGKEVERCEYELFVEKYFGLKNVRSDRQKIDVDYLGLVNMLCMFKQAFVNDKKVIQTCKKCKSFVFNKDGTTCASCGEPVTSSAPKDVNEVSEGEEVKGLRAIRLFEFNRLLEILYLDDPTTETAKAIASLKKDLVTIKAQSQPEQVKGEVEDVLQDLYDQAKNGLAQATSEIKKEYYHKIMCSCSYLFQFASNPTPNK